MARAVITQGVSYAAAGVALGLPAAYLLTRLMSSLLFGVTTHDPVTFASLPLLVVCVTTLACYIPARRASRVDPVTAIRQD
jgi:ABC-type antimicrobial peptide transport system permease subunit